ncbi:MAG: putative hydrolase [Burkholderiaceae bacterium]|nr:putative hydrolase [Burkholderiaceae bacterium]
MIDLSKLGLEGLDLSFLPPSILGRLSFSPTAPVKPPFPPGRHRLGLSAERDTILVVPEGMEASKPVRLLVMFHGANGSAEKVLPFFEHHAHQRNFLLLVPQSTFATWDLTIAGNGPDLERLDQALAEIASRYEIDRNHFGFCGFSDGASYSLSIGVSNGDRLSHVIALSGGFMNAYQPIGKPLIFIAHSPEDEQLPIDASGRKHVRQLKEAGYEVEYFEFNGRHVIHPHVVERAVDFFLNRSKSSDH